MSRLFVTGVPVIGKNMIGRENEKKQIKRLLINGQSVILYAPRRMGKTSLALTILDELKKEGYFVGQTDIFQMPTLRILCQRIIETTLNNKKLEKLIKALNETISQAFKNIEFKQVIDDFEWILRFTERDANQYDLFTDALDFPEQFSKKHKVPMIMFYDEIGDIEKFNGKEIIKLMRSKFQLHSNVTYLFAGSQQSIIENIFVKQSGPFYRFGQLIPLGNIDLKSLKKFIKDRYNTEKINISVDALETILNITKGHPYYTQLLCRELHFYAIDNKIQIIPDVVKLAFEETIKIEELYLSKLWEEIAKNSAQLIILQILVEKKGSIFNQGKQKEINVYRTLNSLVQKGILKREGKGDYQFSDPLFAEYVKNRFKGV